VSATPASIPASPTLPPQAQPTSIPWLGLLAVLMGTFISTLNGRLSNFGLNDVRGAVHAGFDEGAWITTAQTVAQMFIAIAAVWLGSVYGPRRVLLWASLSFALISLVSGFAASLPMLLCLQFAGGIASGFFIPLTLGFILLNTPPKYWAFGIALYALNLELSLNISASLEGWYVEHLSWRFIFWQNVPLALIMTLCLRHGMKPTPININRPPTAWFGLTSGGIGLALIYAGLDQGNRLDWLNSGLVWGLLLAGGLLFVSFIIHEHRTPHPLINIKLVTSYPLPFLLLLVAFLRLSILATAFLIPLFLGSVRGFRALEVGDTLWWIAAPQLILCPLAGLMLRRSDPRLVACIGLSFIAAACLMVAWNITPVWGSEQFLPSQLLQAVGQSFALSGLVFFSVLHLKPQDALTFGAALQTARLMGGEIGTAAVATLARVRGQVASNLIGQHVRVGDPDVLARIRAYGAATTRVFDPTAANSRGATVLSSVVRSAATTQAVIDCFVAIAALAALALLVLVFMRSAPLGPASAVPWIPSRSPKPS
jgi:MFS transporter, DHA2 family, multidrug resistance protein